MYYFLLKPGLKRNLFCKMKKKNIEQMLCLKDIENKY